MKNGRKILGLVTVAFIIGCGGGGSSSTSQNSQADNIIKGKVVDGYVKGAKICADLNKNFKCDTNEPATLSDANGNYSLKVPKNTDFILISTGGIDTETNTPAITMYSLPKYKNITPLTSLAVKEGEEKVAEFFNINKSQIATDPMKNNEIENIVKNIVNNVKITGKYQLLPSHIITSIKETNTTKNKEINTTKSNDINKSAGNNNIPPELSGNLTPPQIGE